MGNIFDIPKIVGQTIKRENPIRFNEFEFSNLLAGYPLPPYPKGLITADIDNMDTPEATTSIIELKDKTQYTIFGTPMCVPLSIKKSSDSESAWWLLPVEPIITIDSENVLIKRNVSKMPVSGKTRRGTIKERWAQNDYNISIEGLLTTVGDTIGFPESDLQKLMSYCEAREPIDVLCPIFEKLNIHRIVIEKWSLPFTKGPENQAYSITAVSDDDWDLFIKLDVLNSGT